MTQHGCWNSTHHPFLLCKCLRNDGVINNKKHKCKLIRLEEHIDLYMKSKEKWELEHKAKFDGRHTRKWTVEDHRSWVDSKNFGVSHFGLHPTLLRLDEVRIDTLHCSCSIGRKLLDYLRVFITKFSDSFQERF